VCGAAFLLTKMYRVEYADDISDDLAGLRAYDRKRILDRLEKQLRYEPSKTTKNRKPLHGLVPPWEHTDPVWELRIGEYRVFYDVDEQASLVTVRAIRHKPPHKTTEEIL
jgi:mRNA-degrading endonuclease RelE of RelBE toxin-antitoxin system